jgi:ABC-type Fe3+ transport system permease subunit
VLPLLANTLLLCMSVLAIAVPAGSATAWVGFAFDWPGRRIALAALIGWLALPLYLQAAAWDAAVGRQGWLGPVLGMGGAPLLDGWPAAIVYHALVAWPWVAAIVGLGLRAVEPELVDMALLDGPPTLAAWRVLLPRVRGSLWVAAAWVVAQVSGEMTITDMFRIRTFAEVLYSDFALDPDPARAALRLAPGVGLIALIVLVMLRLAAPWHAGPRQLVRKSPSAGRLYASHSSASHSSARHSSASHSSARHSSASHFLQRLWSRERWPTGIRLGLSLSLLIGVAVLVPLGSLVWKLGGVAIPVDGGWVRRWSPAHAALVLGGTPWEFRGEFGWTFAMGGLTALVVLLIVPAAVWHLRAYPCWMALAFSTGAFLAALPGPSFAIVLAAVRLSPALPGWLAQPLDLVAEQSLFFVVLALAVRAAPLCGAVAWQAWRTVPRELLDSATLDGLGPWRQFFAIAVPIRRRTLVAIGLLAWCLAAGDLTSSVLLAPARVSPVAVRTFQLIHAGVDDRLAGLCLVSLAVFGILASGFHVLTRRDRLWE